MDDLTGLQVILTRPHVQGAAWAQRLVASGASVALAPMLEIVPIQDESQVRAVKNRILDIDLYQKVIFVSQNAVEYGCEWLDNYWPQLPIRIDFFAVGEATARMLQSYGINVTDLAQSQTGAMTSETLLQSPALQQVDGEKILIMRGLGGRTHLGDELLARGAKVDYCELYERRIPVDAAAQLKVVLPSVAKDSRCVVVLQSGEALNNLVTSLQQIFTDHTRYRDLALLVPSARVRDDALFSGFTRVYLAANATEASMEQQLREIRNFWADSQ